MDMQLRKYAPLWSKYRPAILRMMLEAAEKPQQYRLMQHEFLAMDSKKKGSFSFSLVVSKSKAVNNIKESEMAQDLLNMLQQSKKGSELLGTHSYEIMLDRQFNLHVSQVNQEQG